MADQRLDESNMCVRYLYVLRDSTGRELRRGGIATRRARLVGKKAHTLQYGDDIGPALSPRCLFQGIRSRGLIRRLTDHSSREILPFMTNWKERFDALIIEHADLLIIKQELEERCAEGMYRPTDLEVTVRDELINERDRLKQELCDARFEISDIRSKFREDSYETTMSTIALADARMKRLDGQSKELNSRNETMIKLLAENKRLQREIDELKDDKHSCDETDRQYVNLEKELKDVRGEKTSLEQELKTTRGLLTRAVRGLLTRAVQDHFNNLESPSIAGAPATFGGTS